MSWQGLWRGERLFQPSAFGLRLDASGGDIFRQKMRGGGD